MTEIDGGADAADHRDYGDGEHESDIALTILAESPKGAPERRIKSIHDGHQKRLNSDAVI